MSSELHTPSGSAMTQARLNLIRDALSGALRESSFGGSIMACELLDEVDRLRAKNTELNRRCQLAEAAVKDRVALCPADARDSRGLGRILLGASLAAEEAENDALREALIEALDGAESAHHDIVIDLARIAELRLIATDGRKDRDAHGHTWRAHEKALALKAAIRAITVDLPDDQPNGAVELAIDLLSKMEHSSEANEQLAALCNALADETRALRLAAEAYFGGDFGREADGG